MASLARRRALVDTPALTNLAGPVAPTPLTAPNLPQSPTPPPLGYTPPTIGAAPTATPFGAFTPPTPGTLSPAGQFRIDQAQKGAERSAAARGSLLSGGFQMALARQNQGLASEEYGNDYNRALAAYEANRATAGQNFGQSLAGYQAGTGAALDAGRLNLAGATAGYDRTYGAQRDQFQDAREAALTQAGVTNTNAAMADAHQQQMAEYQAALEEQAQMAEALSQQRQAEENARRLAPNPAAAGVAAQNAATSALQRKPMGVPSWMPRNFSLAGQRPFGAR